VQARLFWQNSPRGRSRSSCGRIGETSATNHCKLSGCRQVSSRQEADFRIIFITVLQLYNRQPVDKLIYAGAGSGLNASARPEVETSNTGSCRQLYVGVVP